jgi:hypothetical protein
MGNGSINQGRPGTKKISVDTWAVLLGLLLAALVRFGALKHIPW